MLMNDDDDDDVSGVWSRDGIFSVGSSSEALPPEGRVRS